MEARNTTLKAFLDHEVQFSIPLYQRSYEWERKHCVQLYNDIKKAGASEGGKNHFIGAITYVGVATRAEEIHKYQIIDGQQRLITLQILLATLMHSLGNTDTKLTNKIKQVLLNESEQGEEHYKLIASKKDNVTLQAIIDKGETDEVNGVATNFNYLKEMIERDAKMNKNNLDIIWRGFCKLTAVSILIETNDDDPQAIFESMNSTGMDLYVTDLIRNYTADQKSVPHSSDVRPRYAITSSRYLVCLKCRDTAVRISTMVG